MNLHLRDVIETDLQIFFDYQQDPEAINIAAFTAKDPSDKEGFMDFWQMILNNETIIVKTIVVNDEVVGHMMSYEEAKKPEVTYWLGRDFWGKGIATRALTNFLADAQTKRPIYARVVKDNVGSARVLEKCGFVIIAEDKGFANGRGAEVEEFILRLD